MKKYLLFCLLPFLACQKETTDTPEPDASLLPLVVGNYWIYEVKFYDRNGTMTVDNPADTMKVYSAGSKPGYYSIAEDGSEQLYSSSTEIKSYLPNEDDIDWGFLKTDKLDTFRIVYTDDGYKYVFVAYPDKFQVLNRACYKNEYFTYDPNSELTGKDIYYVSPGVGLIRMEYYNYRDSQSWLNIQQDLVDFKIDN